MTPPASTRRSPEAEPRARAAPGRLFERVSLDSNPRFPSLNLLIQGLYDAGDHREMIDGYVRALRETYGRTGFMILSTQGLNALAGEFRITRWMDDTSDRLVDPAIDPWTGEGAPVQRGGLLGEIVSHPDMTLVHDLRLESDPALGDWIAQFRSFAAVPVMDEGVIGTWTIRFDRAPSAISEEAFEQLVMRASLLGVAVRSVRATARLRAANRWIENEVDQIARIQKALLPSEMPAIPGVTVAADYRTYDKAGGDYYTFFPLAERARAGAPLDPLARWCVLIADASGHGPAAAVMMAMLHTIVMTLPETEAEGRRAFASPAALLARLNREIAEHKIDGSFVTAYAAFFDPRTRRLEYASAGHPSALVKTQRSSDAGVRLNAAAGLPLGIFADSEYESASVTLATAQTVVLYTDGITEAMSPPRPRAAASAKGEVLESGWGGAELRGEMFGVGGIERALAECSGEPKCVIQSIFDALRDHESGQRPGDDQTIVAIGIDAA